MWGQADAGGGSVGTSNTDAMVAKVPAAPITCHPWCRERSVHEVPGIRSGAEVTSPAGIAVATWHPSDQKQVYSRPYSWVVVRSGAIWDPLYPVFCL